MSHSKEEIQEFLDTLATTPFISHACKKAGISKATVYRWMEADPKFKKEALQALADGRKNLIDVAEMALVGKIKESDMNAIKYFLSHNSKRYKPQPTVRQQEFEIEKKLKAEPEEEKFIPMSDQTWELVALLEQAKKQIRDAGGNPYAPHTDPERPTDTP